MYFIINWIIITSFNNYTNLRENNSPIILCSIDLFSDDKSTLLFPEILFLNAFPCPLVMIKFKVICTLISIF